MHSTCESHIPFAQGFDKGFCRNILSNFASEHLLLHLLSIFLHNQMQINFDLINSYQFSIIQKI